MLSRAVRGRPGTAAQRREAAGSHRHRTAFRRAALCTLSSLLLLVALPSAPAASSVKSAPTVAFTERFRAVQHGGIVRAANSSITCESSATPAGAPCAMARMGAEGRNGDGEMTYIDIDGQRDTYNSSSAELVMPAGSRVTYARLYWGANLRVGEQKPARDNGRVLIAEPGGAYKEVLADTVIGHRTTPHTDGFSASADVTRLVRDSGSGYWTVAQINVARGHSAAGAWGGWTLVVAYENPDEPLRHLVIRDGFETVTANREHLDMSVADLAIPRGASGSLGVVAYNGDRGLRGDSLSVRTGDSRAVRLGDAANPVDDVMNSTIADHGRHVVNRRPAFTNTLGYDSDVLDLTPAMAAGGDRLALRFTTGSESYQLGVVFLQITTRR
ncbi:hypothetical protein PJ985_01745 [Streptomyces sp. ACA25]|uniref:DUF3344 domain-containing protein n=1 Tax=Streptomyces sp. ACA25 TaxID=3022596 RepID=UPI002307BA24|nr:DUF3344 domain-containing protein [Streptomyces sp. ACA25]MDB1086295.1 hypothetical protein [Streptomyces sp. ACA25]